MRRTCWSRLTLGEVFAGCSSSQTWDSEPAEFQSRPAGSVKVEGGEMFKLFAGEAETLLKHLLGSFHDGTDRSVW